MATSTAPETSTIPATSAPETKYKLADMFRIVNNVAEFAFGDKFKLLLITWQLQAVHTYVFNAIAFATKAEFEAMGPALTDKLLGILLWQSKRLNGTWVPKTSTDGVAKKLRFANSWDQKFNKYAEDGKTIVGTTNEDDGARREYWKRLNMAIENVRRGGR